MFWMFSRERPTKSRHSISRYIRDGHQNLMEMEAKELDWQRNGIHPHKYT